MQPILFARPLFRLRSIPSFVPKCHRVFESSIGLSKPGASLQKQVQKSLALPNKQKSYQKAAEAGEILIYHCPIPRILAVQLSRLAAICLGVGSIVVAYASLKDAERPDFEPLYVLLGGLAPIALIAFTAAPLVKTVYLEIPAYLQASKPALDKFLANPPPDTRIILNTQRVIGIDLRGTCTIRDLRPSNSWFRPVNVAFVHPKTGALGRKFWLREKSGLKKTDPLGIPGVWEVVLDSIRKNPAGVGSSRPTEGLTALRHLNPRRD